MGYKELFIDYNLMNSEDIKRNEEIRLNKLKETNPKKYNEELEKRKNIKRRSNIKYKKGVNLEEKKNLVENLEKYGNKVLDYHYDYDFFKKINFNIKLVNYEEAAKLLMKIELSTFLGINVGKGVNFPCLIIPNNIASININTKGEWRYFTRNNENTEGYVLGIIDITEIVYNKNYYKAIEKLCEMTSIDVEEGKWIKLQRQRYYENIGCIHNFEKVIKGEYPILFKYIKKHMYILEELNRHGVHSITNKEKSVNDLDIFFISSRYIEKKLKARGIEKSYTNINKLINMFTVLGFIVKVPLSQVPEKFQEETKKYMNRKSSEVVKNYEVNKRNCHPISFYQIPLMSLEILLEAEKRVLMLQKEGIKATGVIVSSDSIKKALGDSLYNNLFEDKINFINGVEKAKTAKREENKKKTECKETSII